MYNKASEKLFAVAPMMDWTDRHCRFLHRQLTRRTLLYSEMVVADAVIHGNRERLIGFDPVEHPVALQLGGCEPGKLAEAARIAADFGYDEINLNVGCPSDRVKSGRFGACLMLEPGLVAECVRVMKADIDVPVTVKCRLGVDDQDPETALNAMADAAFDTGSDALWVHARKAWMQGLSPKENRDIPPLDYDRVFRLKDRLPNHFIGINGGIEDLNQALYLSERTNGVMLGRAAYQNAGLLADIDGLFYAAPAVSFDWIALRDAMMDYAERHMAAGGRLIHVTRHMVGLFHGYPGARRYRQILSTGATRTGIGASLIAEAFDAVRIEEPLVA